VRALPDRIVVVTDRHQAPRPLEEVVEDVLRAGARWVWLRDRDLEPDERQRLAERLLAATRRAGANLTIGADIALAADIGAEGIHLPRSAPVDAARSALGPQALIGVSAHSLAEVEEAAVAGADYATLSPIFASPSKPGYGPALGLEAITHAASRLPVVALGGICAHNAGDCLAAGAVAVAVMGAIMGSARPAQAFADLARAVASPIRLTGLTDSP
jgi:thiamine-phosphate pyrophosphorylase